MRPLILNPIFSRISIIKGVGTKTVSLFRNLLRTQNYEFVGGECVIGDAGENVDENVSICEVTPKIVDLLYHLPSGIIDRTKTIRLSEAKSGDLVTTVVRVEEHKPSSKFIKPYRVRCYNPSGFITLVFFKVYQDWINKNLKIGSEVAISGKVDVFRDGLQMAHPDYIVPKKDLGKIQTIDRAYPLTAGLTQKFVKKVVNFAIARTPDLPEWINNSVVKQEEWESWKESISKVHFPTINPDDDMQNIYRRRLAYDELFANQIAMKIVRKNIKNADGRIIKISNDENNLRHKLLQKLGFELTGGQKKVLQEILGDLASHKKMLRLLQGDVGSGKTVVALIAMLAVIEDGKQAVIMAPTGILANQHYEWFLKVCDGLGIKVGLLTGKVKGKKREKVLEDVNNGDVDILVGTHALVQDWVKFKDLALVVIDEQHKFGVLQRLALTEKGNKPDVLLMTATPIPRTLTLTIYGDTDISSLKEKPINRKPIDTKIISGKKIRGVVEGLKRVVAKGEKIFWVCPLIEESEESYMANVEDRFQKFKKIFGEDVVGLIHGKMKANVKEKIMENYVKSDGKIKILIATTVVEVGVDVPDATVMVIENTEHFGLSQLHQLRGRVGRSDKKSYCILLYGRVGEAGIKRLDIMRRTNDGFLIAEEDLKIRGAGEMLGTKQSGLPSYKVASLKYDYDLLNKASQDARLFLEKDAKMESERGKAVRILLYLFSYDSSLRLKV